MPLIDDKGRVAADGWTLVAEPEKTPEPYDILRLARLRALTEIGAPLPTPLGVRLASGDHPDALGALLAHIQLVAIEFPKFRDGRGFTIARTLRERLGFAGEIRAIGHILPDQYLALLQCGFTTVAAADHIPVERWTEALAGTESSPPEPRTRQLFNRLAPRGG